MVGKKDDDEYEERKKEEKLKDDNNNNERPNKKTCIYSLFVWTDRPTLFKKIKKKKKIQLDGKNSLFTGLNTL